MAGFTNKVINPPRADKPHIIFMGGWWRISFLNMHQRLMKSERWSQAHAFAARLNNAR